MRKKDGRRTEPHHYRVTSAPTGRSQPVQISPIWDLLNSICIFGIRALPGGTKSPLDDIPGVTIVGGGVVAIRCEDPPSVVHNPCWGLWRRVTRGGRL